MGIPAIILLITYFVVVCIIFVFAIFNLYHVVRYALQARTSIIVTLIFILGFLIITGTSASAIANIDWGQSFYFNLSI